MIDKAARLGALVAVALFGVSGCATFNSAKDAANDMYSAAVKKWQGPDYRPDKPVVLFILDTSGSMQEMQNGVTKLDIAKRSIIDSISQIDRNRYNTSLITFSKSLPCQANVAVKPSNSNPDNVVQQINSVEAIGNTPLAEAIALSGRVLDQVDKKLVILFSDGKQTCSGNPEQEAKVLAEKYGIQLNLQVIGYAVDPETEQQLQRISRMGQNWGYHRVNDSAGLANVINVIATQAGVLDPIWVDINTSTFEFSPGSATLGPEYYTIIYKLYNYLKNNNKHIAVIGHTDATGSSAGNLALSRERANIVKNELIRLGISESRITTDGKGEYEPVAANETEIGRRKNRRVVIKVKN